MSYVYQGPGLTARLLGNREVEAALSAAADVDAMVAFELALVRAQARTGFITNDAATSIENALADFSPDFDALAEGVVNDGLSPPALVKQLRRVVGSVHASSVHIGATSQDLVDTSLMLRLKSLMPSLAMRIDTVLGLLAGVADSVGRDATMMAHTRMQRALPISLGDKIDMWSIPLAQLKSDQPRRFLLQLGGPEGARGQLGDKAVAIAGFMAEELELESPARCWHTDRRPVLEIASWAAAVTTALGKLGQDIALMAQNELAEVTLAAGGSSSAMAHKTNPVAAEGLVTLARHGATLMGGLHQAALHENERSGAGWTLEWLLLPPLLVSLGAALGGAERLLESVQINVGNPD